MRMWKSVAAAAFIASLVATGALAQACANRGDLDARYCDENGDLVADTPKDPKQWQNPATLVFSYTPVEDPAVYENVFGEFMAHLAKVTGKRVRWFPAESYAAQVEAMRSGRLHIAGVATGPTPYAVNLAGFEPLVAMKRADGSIGYTLQLITHKDSSIRKIKEAFLTFDFKNSKLGAEFKDTEKFGAIDYKEAWRDVRAIQKASGIRYTQESLSKLPTKAE